MTILALIVGAVFVAVVVCYVFPEKTAAFIIDKARSAAGFEKVIKNHQTVIIKDCGHVPMIEKPRQTARHYLEFIENLKNDKALFNASSFQKGKSVPGICSRAAGLGVCTYLTACSWTSRAWTTMDLGVVGQTSWQAPQPMQYLVSNLG